MNEKSLKTEISFIRATLVLYAYSSVVYYIVYLFKKDVVRPIAFHMPMYQSQYPYHFIALVCIIFFGCLQTFLKIQFKKRTLNYFAFYIIWILLSSFFGGMLWSYFDMKEGYFPKGDALWLKLSDDTKTGLLCAPIMILISSIPYNIFVFAGSFFLLRKTKTFKPDSADLQSVPAKHIDKEREKKL